MTKHNLRIFDKPKKNISRTDQVIQSESNCYINFHKDVKAKLFINKPGYH